MNLQNKLVFITGASSGIGLATAKQFASLGVRLSLGTKRIQKMAAVKQKLENMGSPEVLCTEIDVRKIESVEGFL